MRVRDKYSIDIPNPTPHSPIGFDDEARKLQVFSSNQYKTKVSSCILSEAIKILVKTVHHIFSELEALRNLSNEYINVE